MAISKRIFSEIRIDLLFIVSILIIIICIPFKYYKYNISIRWLKIIDLACKSAIHCYGK